MLVESFCVCVARLSTPHTHMMSYAPSIVPSYSASSASDDVEYRSQLKSIFLHLVDRCISVMELERESVSTLAVLRNGKDASYLSLFGSSTIESFLRVTFDVDSVVSPGSGASPLEREQAFAILVKAAQQRAEQAQTSTAAQMNRIQFTDAIKKVCTDVQSELRTSLTVLERNAGSFQRAPELMKSFNFFIKTFDFTKGDIANDAKLLERNVDEIIALSSE